MKTTTRWTAAAAVSLALTAAVVAPAPVPSAAPSAEAPPPLAVDAATVLTDTGGHSIGNKEFATVGAKWATTDLTYGFINSTSDLSVSAQRAAIASALATWSSVTPLSFALVDDCGLGFNAPACTAPVIRVTFGSGDHNGGGDDPNFDGAGGTAAHGFYPAPGGASAGGDVHFDDAERWTSTGGGVDLEMIALHEIGHALGLGHASQSQCPSSPSTSRPIMCALLVGTDRTLATDDINGIRSLYGSGEPAAVTCAGKAVTVDLNAGDVLTAGPDVVLGTPGADTINALDGSDTVCGMAGDDVIDLGLGADKALGGPGNDTLRGGDGVDTLTGSGGNDTMAGGPLRDTCDGRGGQDTATGCEVRLGVP